MLRTSNTIVSTSWKRLSVNAKGQLRQSRLLSSVKPSSSTPSGAAAANSTKSAVPPTNKPPSSNLPPPKKGGGGGGFSAILFLTTALAGGLGYVAYEKEMGNNSIAEHIASQPIIVDLMEPTVAVLKAAGLLTPPPKVTPYHHKTTAEIIEESHKHDPHPDEMTLTQQPEATSESHSDDHHHHHHHADNVTVEEDSASNITELDEEAIRTAESAINQLAHVVTDTIAEVEAQTSVSNNNEHVHNDAIETESETVETSTAAPAHPHLPEVSSEMSMKSSSTSSSSREILQTAAKTSLVLRQELEQLMLKDVDTMDAPALRLRVTQLATELFERLSWENMRLNHAITQVEEEMTSRYEKLFARQRKELEFEIEKILFEKEKALSEATATQQQQLEEKYAAQMQQAIKAQAEGFQATLQQALKTQEETLMHDFQSQANQHHAYLRKQHNDELLQTQQQIESLRQEVAAAQKILSSLGNTVEETMSSHSISTAILSLESILSQPSTLLRKQQTFAASSSSSSPVKAQLDRVRSLAQGDDLVISILNSLPARVQQEGAPTLSELQVRFAIMREEARKVALAPEQAPKMIGQLIGTVLANVSSSPNGYISGPGVEESLARAAFFLERGKLKEAVVEVNGMEGYAKKIAHDWVLLAEDRLLVDQAVRALKADSIIRHRNFNR